MATAIQEQILKQKRDRLPSSHCLVWITDNADFLAGAKFGTYLHGDIMFASDEVKKLVFLN